jgi:nitrite reductase (NADH) small subunit
MSDSADTPVVWTPLCDSSAGANLLRSEEIADGTVREAIAGDRVVAVGRASGELFAVDGICLHAGGPLGEGRLSGTILTCPWHGWQYDVRTGRTCLNERICTEVFPIRVEEDGRVSVGLE